MPANAPSLVLVHGLAKKPPRNTLETIWRWALDIDNPKPELFGYDNPGLQVAGNLRLFNAYWADVFHVDCESDFTSYYEAAGDPPVVESVDVHKPSGVDPAVPDEARAFVDRLTRRLVGDGGPSDGAPPAQPAGAPATPFERVPLPGFVKDAVVKEFAVEAYYFLENKPFTRSDGQVFQARAELRRRFAEQVRAARQESDRVVVLSHSMGTMIAYDSLRNDPDCPPVHGWITLGSPLGLDEVQDGVLPAEGSSEAFPSGRLLGDWVNVYDPLDPICGLDPKLANDFLRHGERAVIDIREDNWGSWRHTITHYLQGPKLRAELRRLTEL
ncbi:MAG TPA: hypothetical protein PKC59_04840 [Burkholderiaceae bacterium]|nr:hypothetical protein [Burkholderiaceae bacterium]HMX09552.1 hypothetical protein [Burkholderiaceae bacterium]HMY99418.1 hypothetical protein [Burkholderiaceae bacterium]HNB44809.1 hypothetical protein [Burkholderiaceae bacterium]HNG80501.1 hypothetical protein [Burkholderiaceae bacterium]